MDKIERFLTESVIAHRARVPSRVLLRSGAMTGDDLSRTLERGEVSIDWPARCELVAGEETVAVGEIVRRDGRLYFRAKER